MIHRYSNWRNKQDMDKYKQKKKENVSLVCAWLLVSCMFTLGFSCACACTCAYSYFTKCETKRKTLLS